jgi:hypothetical protein
MISDLALRWIVTALFAFSALECVWALIVAPRPWTRVVSLSLHCVMAVAMGLMAWPISMSLPTVGPAQFFLIATVWFVVATFIVAGHRWVNAYHAVMMLAMSWMYVVMSGSLLPKPAVGLASAGGNGGHGGHAMPNMPNMIMPTASAESLQDPPLIVGLNWLLAVGFGIAAVLWVIGVLRHRFGSAPDNRHTIGMACQAMMAAGMAVMFLVML